MTIKNWIINQEIRKEQQRLIKLLRSNAPKKVTNNVENKIKQLKEGILRIGGNQSLLEEEADDPTHLRKNNALYILFKGSITYFPDSKHGLYIAKGNINEYI